MNILKNIKKNSKVCGIKKQLNLIQNYMVRNGNRKSGSRQHFAMIG